MIRLKTIGLVRGMLVGRVRGLWLEGVFETRVETAKGHFHLSGIPTLFDWPKCTEGD